MTNSITTLLTALSNASPIGPIPLDYPYTQELCDRASIGFKMRSRKDGENVAQWRDWFVIWDKQLAPSRSRTPSGKLKLDFTRLHRTCTNHLKFCAILAFIEHRGEQVMEETLQKGKLGRMNLLDLAIQKTSELKLPDGSTIDLGLRISQLWDKDWRQVYEECAQAGMKEYALGSVEKAPVPSKSDGAQSQLFKSDLPKF